MDKKVCGVIPLLTFIIAFLLLCAGIIFFFCMYRALEILEVIQRHLEVILPNIGIYKMFVVAVCFGLILLLIYNLCYSIFGDSEKNSYLVRAGPSFLIIVLTVLLQLCFLLILTTMTIGWLISDLVLATESDSANATRAMLDGRYFRREGPLHEMPAFIEVDHGAHRYEYQEKYADTPKEEDPHKRIPSEKKPEKYMYVGNVLGPYKYHEQVGSDPEQTQIKGGRVERDVIEHPYYGTLLFANDTNDYDDLGISEELLQLIRLRRQKDRDKENRDKERDKERDNKERDVRADEEEEGEEDNETLLDYYFEDYTPDLAETARLLFVIAIISNILIILLLGLFTMIRVYNFQYMYVDSCVVDMCYDDNCCTTSSHSTRTDCCGG